MLTQSPSAGNGESQPSQPRPPQQLQSGFSCNCDSHYTRRAPWQGAQQHRVSGTGRPRGDNSAGDRQKEPTCCSAWQEVGAATCILLPKAGCTLPCRADLSTPQSSPVRQGRGSWAGKEPAGSKQGAYLIIRDFHAADGERRLEVGKAQKWRPGAAGNKLKKGRRVRDSSGERGLAVTATRLARSRQTAAPPGTTLLSFGAQLC